MIKFSFIVPIYNVEKYLHRCIDSLINQSYNNYEIILVNDGSTDNSGVMCDEFAESCNKIKVIHKNNGGLSDARNAGLITAKGEYIIFVDSDDYIELDILEKFKKNISANQKPDVIITKIKKVYSKDNIKLMDKNMPVEDLLDGNKEKLLKWMFSSSDNLWPAVRYIVKNELIKKNDLKFAVGYFHEDIDWTSKLFLYANKFTILDLYWYNHRMGRQGSITNTKNVKRSLDVIELVEKNISNVDYDRLTFELKKLIFTRLVKSVFSNLGDYKYYNKNDRETIIKSLVLNKEIFKYTSEINHKIFILFCRLFGFKMGLELMSFFRR